MERKKRNKKSSLLYELKQTFILSDSYESLELTYGATWLQFRIVQLSSQVASRENSNPFNRTVWRYQKELATSSFLHFSVFQTDTLDKRNFVCVEHCSRKLSTFLLRSPFQINKFALKLTHLPSIKAHFRSNVWALKCSSRNRTENLTFLFSIERPFQWNNFTILNLNWQWERFLIKNRIFIKKFLKFELSILSEKSRPLFKRVFWPKAFLGKSVHLSNSIFQMAL